MSKPTYWRVFLQAWDNGRQFTVRTNVYALTAQDAETHARAAAATEGWCVVLTKTQPLPL
jgi:hypothetical protein